MSFVVTTVFPKESLRDNERETEATHKETLFDLKKEEVLAIYEQHERSGYVVAVSYDAGNVEEKSPFEIAKDLDLNGIPYTAKIKFLEKSNTGTYEQILALSQLIERHGFDKYRVGIDLKFNEESVIDLNNTGSWFHSEDATYKLTPELKSKDILELKGVYDDLVENNYQVAIDIKPGKTADVGFDAKLAAFPDGTFIKFVLSNGKG